MYNRIIISIYIAFLFSFFFLSCKKDLKVSEPVYTANKEIIYKTDASAATVLNGIYSKMFLGDLWRISLMGGLSSDELTLFDGNTNILLAGLYKNSLTGNAMIQGFDNPWKLLYPIIFFANSAIEGINQSTGMTQAAKTQLIGEAKFIRAFSHFYLTSLFGDVPLVLTTDYKQNSLIAKTAQDQVWAQIIMDLKDAQTSMSAEFRDGSALSASAERVRPTSWAATALLARVYLNNKMYPQAEAEASKIISNTSLFSLNTLDGVFLKNSLETIWQLQAVANRRNTFDGILYVVPATGVSTSFPVSLSDTLVKSFEPGDSRRSKWIGSVSVNGKEYFYPFKYKVSKTGQPITEYLMIFRLGEQLLIRAEARINQAGKIAEGIADLNELRSRARGSVSVDTPNPLPALPTTLDKEAALNAVYHERQVELFTEWGHRWFDLKRVGRVNQVMGGITPLKGGTWNSNMQLYPIPIDEIKKNSNLKQNEGYKD